MPAAVAIPAIIGAAGVGANIFSGVKGSSAAKKASDLQYQATEQARQDLLKTANDVNPGITTAADLASADAKRAAGEAGATAFQSADRANNLLDPFRTAGQESMGTLQDGLAAGGDFNRNFTAADFQADPGYDFRLKEAQKAIERSAAANGTGMGGSVLKALSRYSSDYASSEYGKAFDRFSQQNTDRYNRLMGVSKIGYDAAGREGTNLTDAGKYSGDAVMDASKFGGSLQFDAAKTTANNTLDAHRSAADLLTQGANARASGVVGSANAWSGAVKGAVGSATDAAMLSVLMKNPAIARVPYQSAGVPKSYGVRAR